MRGDKEAKKKEGEQICRDYGMLFDEMRKSMDVATGLWSMSRGGGVISGNRSR